MEELDLKELFQIFWEKKVQIALIVAIFAIIGVIYSVGFVKPKYKAKTSLILATNSSSQTNAGSITTTDVTLNSKLVSTYIKLVKSDKVVRNVISNLALDMDEEELKNSVSVTTTNDTEFIEISVENADPVLATKIANEVSKVLIENVKEFYKAENVHVVDLAEIPQAPYNVNHVKDAVIFAFIGIVVAVLYVLVLNMLDTSVKSEDDIEKITGLRVLVSLPLYETNTPRNKRGGRR
jgi:capsular polysaccharide biosynthesis protein